MFMMDWPVEAIGNASSRVAVLVDICVSRTAVGRSRDRLLIK